LIVDFSFFNGNVIRKRAGADAVAFLVQKRNSKSTENQLAPRFSPANEKAARQQGSLFFKGE
jgi:hypothetical protein